MAIYYSIERSGQDIGERFEEEECVCLYIRAKGLANYKVFEKDDSSVKAQRIDNAVIYPLLPMKKDITERINEILARYDEMEKE